MTNDVVMSFRDEVRTNFICHLCSLLSRKNITCYNNEEEVKKEEEDVIRAIAKSHIALVVFSKNYASSAWCLDELVHIMNYAPAVVPVFYNVDLSDVRHQKGRFGKDFERHEQVQNPETVLRWRKALSIATDKFGFSSQTSVDDSYLSREITRYVSSLLSKSRLHKELLPGKSCGEMSTAKKTSLSRHKPTIPEIPILVAMDRRMKQISGVLKLEITSEIRVIGITGVTGIGKSSIARFLRHKLSPTFQDHCFLDTSKNIHLGTQGIDEPKAGRFYLQKFLSNIHDKGHVSGASSSDSREKLLSPRGLKRKASQTSSASGSYDKRTSYWSQRVLVVVDNVETSKQLEEIMKVVNRLGSGSRVILTTENKSLLVAGGVEHLYEVDCLRYDEALELFSVYAFKEQYPPANFEQLSIRAVQLTGCLPLGLKLLGSFLRGKTKKDWELVLNGLEARQDKAITELSELLKPSSQGKTKEDWE